MFSVGVLGQNLPADHAQSWFALYNALLVNYAISNLLSFSFQVASRYGIITTDIDAPAIIDPNTGIEPTPAVFGTIQRSRHRYGGGVYSAFRFNRNITLHTGIAAFSLTDSYSNSTEGAQKVNATKDASGGTFEISLPVRLIMYFRP